MQLRPYQLDAVDAILNYGSEVGGAPLVEMATGTGKSLVIAEICQRLVRGYNGFKILVATHVKELIEQNSAELKAVWPLAPSGVYSAGLKSRDTYQQIIFCGVQSVHDKAPLFGHVDLLMVDEAHLIPRTADTMYGRFISALRKRNPNMGLVGLTATPYRLGSGRLDQGKGKMFDEIVYTYGIRNGVDDGYLARLVSKQTETGFDLTGVHKKGGEYVEKELQEACDKADTTRRAIDEAVAYGEDAEHPRKSWLAFCAGVSHALHVRDEIRSRGFSCETVTGETPTDERRQHLEDFKAGKIRCLTNANVLTTGFNAPGVDMIMALRPTASTSLYVQMMGRGTRLASDKINCLVLDFAGLIRTHGPVDCVTVHGPTGTGGPAPTKVCPNCKSYLPAATRQCIDCGYEFPRPKPPNLEKASSLDIMSSAPPEWVKVTARNFSLHHKEDKPTSVCVRYQCGFVVHKAWLCPEHEGGARARADSFWLKHGGAVPVPSTANEWIERAEELCGTAEIKVRPEGKYISVLEARPLT